MGDMGLFAAVALCLVLSIAALFAIFELFTISKTLKEIRDELRGEAAGHARDSKSLSII